MSDHRTALRRLLHVVEALARSRWPASTDQIRREVCERSGEAWNQRTIYRDLMLLEETGAVRREWVSDCKRERRRWRWIGAAVSAVPPEAVPV